MKYEVDDIGSTATRERTKAVSGHRRPEAEELEIQKRMEAAATPGPAHRALDALAGNWTAEVKCWMEPGGQPQVSHATAKATWILKGRFLEEEFHGEMMGKPFTGRSLLGYDNLRQSFNSVWISDMQTGIFTSEGKGDVGNKVITLEGSTNCPASGQTNIPMRSVFRVISQDKHVFEMYDGSKGENVKTMEITYTRS